MSPVNQETSSGTVRRRLYSLSSVFRPQATKRASISDAVQEEPTCLEKIHYPVFDPLDPRHNPEIPTVLCHSNEQQSSSSGSRSPMAWVQSLSKRTLHRARSGLLALKSGFSHHPSDRPSEEEPQERSFVSPVALRREIQLERQRHAMSSGGYTSDTQEDPNFGAQLSRMDLPPSSPSSNDEMEPLVRVQSVYPMPAPNRYEYSSRPVSNVRVNSTSTLANGRDLDFQFAGNEELEANMNFEDHSNHTIPSTETYLIQQTWGVAISTDEGIETSTKELADPQSVPGEQQATNLQQQNIGHASSDTQNSDDQPISVPISRQSSAEVRFAFPGIYHEALNEWARQHGSPNLSRHSLDLIEYSPNPSHHSSSPIQHSLSPHSHNLTQHNLRLYEQEEIPCAPQEPFDRIVLQEDTHSGLPPYPGYDEGHIPLVFSQSPITHSEEMQPFSYPNPLNCIPNLNSEEIWSSTSERATTQWSSGEDYSSRYTPADTTSRDITSTEMTSMESTTADTWSPWSPMDSEVLFPSPVEDGDEYFLVDGKSSQYPDGGNEPVKSTRHTTSNCDTTRPQGPTELIPPGIMSLRLMSNGITDAELEFVEEDTDDEFYPGIVQPRQFW
ncbi:hypothetical protein CBS147317_7390 [Penicillium roqueforti]|nr:hypothetical protein CBS147372_7302 [Penicillium roqueforti]KAI3151238.1 hypothetical protein CBS147317_7390 [Penicillium roqueforti]KAI3284107.1 hypothetical protein DTO002I6_9309 [Penicillium roqueforti]